MFWPVETFQMSVITAAMPGRDVCTDTDVLLLILTSHKDGRAPHPYFVSAATSQEQC